MSRCSFVLFICFGLLHNRHAYAGSPAIDESCRDRERRAVAVLYDPTNPVFAMAARLPPQDRRLRELVARRPSEQLSPYVIFINPDRYYLGRETQQWLYLRQCARISRGDQISEQGARELPIREEELADCWALRAMAEDSKTQSYLRSSIERDMERVLRDNRWREVLAGPQRRIALDQCR